MYKIGCFIQLHCGKVLFVGILMLCMCCVGLKTANIETDVQELWVEGKRPTLLLSTFIAHFIT